MTVYEILIAFQRLIISELITTSDLVKYFALNHAV